MNKIAILLVLIPTFCFTQDFTPPLSEYHKFSKKENVFLFADNVNLRKLADEKSEVIDVLSIGQKLEIVENTQIIRSFEGINSEWYKVKYNNKEGYVVGGLIALKKVSFGGVSYLVQLKKNEEDMFLKIRLIKSDNSFSETVTRLSTPEFEINVFGNKGLEGINSIFSVEYFAEACGVDYGGQYFFYDGQRLIKALEYTNFVDGGLFWRNDQVIFPTDSLGIKGKILFISEHGETIQEEPRVVERKIVERELYWRNGKIEPDPKDWF